MSTPWNNQIVSLVIVSAPAGAYAGIFVYSPAPGLGNLIGSWAAQAGTDPYGNAYPQGLNVKVGAISGSTFTGTNFIINSSGMFFYNGVPALGNLATSVAPSSGTDSFGNTYQAGVDINIGGLTLSNQSSAPSSVAGAGVIYMSSGGRLRYINNLGVDMVLDRAAINLQNFSMNTQTIPQQMSGNLAYVGGEGILGSEYEIQIDGTFTSPTGASSTFGFDIFKDGVSFGGGSPMVVGTVIVGSTGQTFTFCVKYRVILNALGVSANVNVAGEGTVSLSGANFGNAQTFVCMNRITVTPTLDTTANHNLAIFCNWTSTAGTGHSAIVYQTRITRRN